jgi:hypothetical protein
MHLLGKNSSVQKNLRWPFPLPVLMGFVIEEFRVKKFIEYPMEENSELGSYECFIQDYKKKNYVSIKTSASNYNTCICV